MEFDLLNSLSKSGGFFPIDIHFSRLMSKLAKDSSPELIAISALVSNSARMGHICFDLSKAKERLTHLLKDEKNSVKNFQRQRLSKKLLETSVIGRPGEFAPMILDNHSRLYLYRYWDYQEKLAQSIKQRLDKKENNIDLNLLKEGLNRLFPNKKQQTNWQKVAAYISVTKKFSVISGGPGTGKTTTVAKILALILEQRQKDNFVIQLATPTGKAAARLQDAIKTVKEGLDCDDDIKSLILENASTIHRLLKPKIGSPYFRYNSQNPLQVDVMIVDEASMVDIALMSKLIQALPSEIKLILIGDKDQLASVEAGSMFGDICGTNNINVFSGGLIQELKQAMYFKDDINPSSKNLSAINDNIVQLKKNYRFEDDSGIGNVSTAINEGKGNIALEQTIEGSYPDITWQVLPNPKLLPGALNKIIVDGFKPYLTQGDFVEVLRAFEKFRVLCAVRKGSYGVESLNRAVEYILVKENLISHDKKWYPGRPVMITANDYNMQLFNGDIGITFSDPENNNELRVCFLTSRNEIRKINPLRLPEHETAYAMTVHKSQGSQFDRILLMLPDYDSPVLTRELIYTGITRSKEYVEIWGREEIFLNSVNRRVERISGLHDSLRSPM